MINISSNNGNITKVLLALVIILSLINVIFLSLLDTNNETSLEIKKDIQEKVIPVVEEIKKDVEEIKKLQLAITEDTIKFGLNKVNKQQSDFIRYIFSRADGISDYKWTLIAISWKESRAGLWPVNLNDPSCGMFHNKVSNVLYREGIEDTGFNRNIICAKLVHNVDFAMKHAIYELDFWNKTHKGDWHKIWGSYNGGYKGNPVYAQEIADLIVLFKYKSNIFDIVQES